MIPQCTGGLADRLAGAFADLAESAVVVGMDTPQLTSDVLRRALAGLERADAVLGPALDWGYWAIGLRGPDPRALACVPMSVEDTCAHQRRRLHHLGLSVIELPVLRDVDGVEDARAVARLAPETAFAARVRRLAA